MAQIIPNPFRLGRVVYHVSLISSLVLFALHSAVATSPVTFIFGDSTLDVGTNDFIPESKAKANFQYYGVDYPHSVSTGRFSNGYNCADRLAKMIGYNESPPSFFSLVNDTGCFKQKILKGVNFASGGSGIFDSTGSDIFVKVVSLGEQIQQFSTVRDNITEIKGPEDTALLLSQSLFIVSVGGNDILEYQRNLTTNKTNLSPPDFIANLLSDYEIHVQNLYNLGARKFGIISIGPLGCCPFARAAGNNNGNCVDELNGLAQAFFNITETLLQGMSSGLPGMNYSIGNVYDITYDIINDPQKVGFTEVKSACCGNGSFNAEAPCDPNAKLCPYRKDYLFWDAFHPTQKAADLAARALFCGDYKYVRPMNFSQLALINL